MLRVFLAAMLVLMFAGCEDKEDDKVFSAQSCLDAATPATVDRCIALVAGITSPQAYAIRCAGAFLKQGLDTPTIVQAVEDLDDPAAGNATLTLFDALVFDDAGGNPDEALVAATVADCRASGSEGILILALTAQTATTLDRIATDLATTIDNFNPATMTPEQLEDAGSTVLDAYPTLCAEGTSLSTSEACKDMRDALTEAGIDPNKSTYTDAEKQEFAEKFLPKL